MPLLLEVRLCRFVVITAEWALREMTERSQRVDEWRMKWMSTHRHQWSRLITAVGNLDGPVNPASQCQTNIFTTVLKGTLYPKYRQIQPLLFPLRGCSGSGLNFVWATKAFWNPLCYYNPQTSLSRAFILMKTAKQQILRKQVMQFFKYCISALGGSPTNYLLLALALEWR